MKTFAVLSSHSKQFPLVDMARWELFCQCLNLLSSSFDINSCFEVFRKACNNGFGLSRPQFLKAIVLLVFAKYLRPEAQSHMRRMITRISSRNVANVVKLPKEFMINDLVTGIRHVFKSLLRKFSRKRTWQEFRTYYVHRVQVSQILIDNMTILRRIYSNWSEIINNKRQFTQSRALQLIKNIMFVTKEHPMERPMLISNDAILASWGLSKLTVKDLQRDYERSYHMVFVEFLEFMCRIAHIAKFQDPNEIIQPYK